MAMIGSFVFALSLKFSTTVEGVDQTGFFLKTPQSQPYIGNLLLGVSENVFENFLAPLQQHIYLRRYIVLCFIPMS